MGSLTDYPAMPTLLHHEKEQGIQHKLEDQVMKLKQQVVELAEQITELQRTNSKLTADLEDKRIQSGQIANENNEDEEEYFVVQK